MSGPERPHQQPNPTSKRASTGLTEDVLNRREGGDFYLAKTGDRYLAIDTVDAPSEGFMSRIRSAFNK